MASSRISVATIKKGLTTRFIGQNVLYYPCLTSTMEAARREVRKNAPEGTVIIAEEQTRGRGRLKRVWFAPPGNIALSIIIYPDISSVPSLILVASLAAVHSIESVTGLKTQVKWPNDVLIGGKKVAGILVEGEVKRNQVAWAIIGIGINTALRVKEIDEIAAVATGLEEHLGRQVSREEIIEDFLNEFERLYLQLPDGGAIFKAWRDRLVTLGKKVTATCGAESVQGVAESVDASGALTIRKADGTLTRVVAGDVTLRE
jgi:BirA family biotin operon repressor/biotin-[acetyl-CoA-carboxylase] ligase